MKWNTLWCGVGLALAASIPITAITARASQTDIAPLLAQLQGESRADLTYDANADGVLDGMDLALLRQEKAAAAATTEATGTETTPVTSDTAETTEPVTEPHRLVVVSNTDELMAALEQAQAGDDIVLKSGVYSRTGSGSNPNGSLFYSGAEGTAEQPITIRSEDPSNPARLCGTDTAKNYVLYLTGDYWQVSDLQISTAQKGIMLDNSNHSRIFGCEVYQIGSEGIHLRDNSSNCLVESCNVHDTGVVTPAYGEAIYIGSAKSTSGYGYSCDNNTILRCQLGPNVGAEDVDIKEYTTGTIIAECVFDGTGMTGENYADSFVDIQGNDCIIRDNVGYRNGCQQITAAIQMHVQADGWGYRAQVYGNRMYMDIAQNASGRPMYLLDGWYNSAVVWDNQIAYEDGVLFDAGEDQYNLETYTMQ